MATLDTLWQADYGYVRFGVTGVPAGSTVFRQEGSSLVPIVGFEDDTWLSGGSGFGEDYRPPLGADVMYVIAPIGTLSWSATLVSDTVTTPSNTAWLRNPINPILAAEVVVISTGEEQLPVRQHVYAVSGRKLALVVHDVREGRRGTVTLLVRDADERIRLEKLLSTGAPLLLTLCTSKVWAPCMMAVGNATFTRISPHTPAGVYGTYGHSERVAGPVWNLALDYIEVSGVVPGTIQRIPTVTWGDLLNNTIPPASGVTPYTWGDVYNPDNEAAADFNHWIDVALGNRRP